MTVGMKEKNRSVKQMKAGLRVSVLKVSRNLRSSPLRPLFASARMVGEMQCPWVVGLHALLNGMHRRHITTTKARVPVILMAMKEMTIFNSVRCVTLTMRRINKYTEVSISPVAMIAYISAMVVYFEASDSVDSTYVVCFSNPRCIHLKLVASPKIRTAYV